jgi:hypothetical protein
MAGRVSVARLLPKVQRGYEFSRRQQQLLALAYEHLLPIIRPQRRSAAATPRPARPPALTTVAP